MLGNIWFSVRERVVVLQEDPAALYNAVLCTVGLEREFKSGIFCCGSTGKIVLLCVENVGKA